VLVLHYVVLLLEAGEEVGQGLQGRDLNSNVVVVEGVSEEPHKILLAFYDFLLRQMELGKQLERIHGELFAFDDRVFG